MDYETLGVISTFQPLYYLSKVFGLVSFATPMITSQASLRDNVTSLILPLCHLCILVYGVYPMFLRYRREMDATDFDMITLFSEVFGEMSSNVFSMLSLVMAMKQRYNVIKFLRGLMCIDREMRRIGCVIKYVQIRRTFSIWLTVVCISMALVLILTVYTYLEPNASVEEHLYWLPIISVYCINKITLVHIISYLYMIYLRFQIINKYIKKALYMDYANTLCSKRHMWLTREIYKHNTYRENDKVYMSPYQNSKTRWIEDDPIPALCSIHDRLCELAKLVNAVTSLQILFITASGFAVSVVNSYVFYLLQSSGKQSVHQIDTMSSSMWVVLSFLDLFILCFTCGKTTGEANSTGLFLQKALSEISTNEIRTKVDMLSLQLSHQRVEFTACGFFTVDLSLMYMLVGSVTTYLVFMIQFEMALRVQLN